MKEFEKWFKKEMKGGVNKYVAGSGWRAALECIKGKIDYAAAGNDMVDWIFEEELDAKTKKR